MKTEIFCAAWLHDITCKLAHFLHGVNSSKSCTEESRSSRKKSSHLVKPRESRERECKGAPSLRIEGCHVCCCCNAKEGPAERRCRDRSSGKIGVQKEREEGNDCGHSRKRCQEYKMSTVCNEYARIMQGACNGYAMSVHGMSSTYHKHSNSNTSFT